MKTTRILLGALLATSAMQAAAPALAQNQPNIPPPPPIEELVVLGRNVPNEKRTTSEVSSLLTAESFQITGDGDIAAALVRVTGVSTQDGFAVVRGLNERYTQILVNNNTFPSVDPLTRGVALDIFPTGLVKNVLVQKTWSPNLPADFGGGVVELRTNSFPSDPFFEFGISGKYNSQSTFRDRLSYDSGQIDWTGFDIGDRDLPDLARGGNTNTLAPAQRELLGESFRNQWSIVFDDTLPDFTGGFKTGKAWDVGSESRFGFLLTGDYSNSFQTRRGERRTVSATGDGGVVVANDLSDAGCADTILPACGFTNTEQTIELNGLASIGYEFNADHRVQATSFLLRQTTKEALLEQGLDFIGGQVEQDTRTDWIERQSWTNQLTGEHLFEIGTFDQLSINWRGAYSEGTRDTKDRRELQFEYDPVLDRFLIDNSASSAARIVFGALFDRTIEAGIDVDVPFEVADIESNFKFGFAWLDQERTSAFQRFFFSNPPNLTVDLRSLVPETLYGPVNIDPNGFVITENTTPSDAFDAGFQNYQYYVQMDAQVTPTVRLAAGGRYEDSEQTSLSFARSTIPCTQLPVFAQPPSCATGPTAFAQGDLIPILQAEEYLLPSASLTWEVFPDHQLRLAYSQTINRPSLRELSTSDFLDPDRDVEVQGNPFLNIAELRNYDLRWEYYLTSNQFITGGFFYKSIDNPIERSFVPQADIVLRTFINGDRARVWGFEVESEFDIPLADYLPWLGTREVFVKGNATYTNATTKIDPTDPGTALLTNFQRDLQGQSPWLGNMQLGWRDPETQERFAILFNYVGSRIESVGTFGRPDAIENLPILIDLVYSRSFEMFGGEYEWNIEFRNLTNSEVSISQGNIVTERYDLGVSVSTGVTVTF